MKKLMVKCPSCEKKFEYYSSEYRPFCCEKCKMVDLGHWLNESYNIPGPPAIMHNEYNEDKDEDYDGELH